jgi:hypothetical protein
MSFHTPVSPVSDRSTLHLRFWRRRQSPGGSFNLRETFLRRSPHRHSKNAVRASTAEARDSKLGTIKDHCYGTSGWVEIPRVFISTGAKLVAMTRRGTL